MITLACLRIQFERDFTIELSPQFKLRLERLARTHASSLRAKSEAVRTPEFLQIRRGVGPIPHIPMQRDLCEILMRIAQRDHGETMGFFPFLIRPSPKPSSPKVRWKCHAELAHEILLDRFGHFRIRHMMQSAKAGKIGKHSSIEYSSTAGV